MNQKIKRIGYACKTSQVNSKGVVESIPKFNTRTTTISWLRRQARAVAEQRLWDLMIHNIAATEAAVKFVSKQPAQLKMFRISSDLLPAYTVPEWNMFWNSADVINYAEKHFSNIGSIAREHDIRLSFHPGQFCCLASDNPDVVQRSIDEFEYHANMARWMGYGNTFQDFKINIHLSGRAGIEGFKASYNKLTSTARNCITVENDEMSYGLDHCLLLGDLVPIVLDIHHHLIKDHEYIESTDLRISKILESWRGVRPVFHYSTSREDVLVNHSKTIRPDIKQLLTEGYKKQQLRAHSQYMWNTASNDWALSHLNWGDMMVEAKAKNLASALLYQYWINT